MMDPFFSAEGARELEKICAKRTLFAFDFDGTLAPTASVPGGARTPPHTCKLMEALRQHVPTAVITGRMLKDLKPRLDFKADHLIGNHGAEGMSVGNTEIARARKVCRVWLREIDQAYHKSGLPAWNYMEDKGQTLTLHYRRVPNRRECRRFIKQTIAKLEPRPRVVGGKYVYNLIPEGLPHKGEALRMLCKKLGMQSAFYIGDDDTDEDVFRGSPRGWMTVRVGAASDSSARFFLRQQNSINRLLTTILATLERSGR